MTRAVATILVLLTFAPAHAAASDARSVTKEYASLTDGQMGYLDELFLDAALLCDEARVGRSVNGACFHPAAGETHVRFTGMSSSAPPFFATGHPYLLAWSQDADGNILDSKGSCGDPATARTIAIPAQTARIVVFAFQPASWNGCAASSMHQTFGAITATFG